MHLITIGILARAWRLARATAQHAGARQCSRDAILSLDSADASGAPVATGGRADASRRRSGRRRHRPPGAR